MTEAPAGWPGLFCCGDCRHPWGHCPLVDRQHPSLSLVRQCALLGVSRSSLYYRPKAASAEDLSLMGEMDRQYLETPYFMKVTAGWESHRRCGCAEGETPSANR